MCDTNQGSYLKDWSEIYKAITDIMKIVTIYTISF